MQTVARTGFEHLRGFARIVGQVGDRCIHIIIVGVAIQRQIMTRQAGFHFDNLVRLDAQAVSNIGHLSRSERLVGRLHAAQVEEELALRLGRGHLDHSPVLQHILMNLGLDPVNGERNQPHTSPRVEALDRFHQADIALLNQIGVWQAVAKVASRDGNHQAQVRQYQLPRGVEIFFLAKTGCQTEFFLCGQQRKLSGGLHIRVNATGCGDRGKSQDLGHVDASFANVTCMILALAALEC